MKKLLALVLALVTLALMDSLLSNTTRHVKATALLQPSELTVGLGSDGRLTIRGTPQADDVLLRLDRAGKTIEVDNRTNRAGTDYSFKLDLVRTIHIFLEAGDDRVILDNTNGSLGSLRPLEIDVGDGDNTVIGSTGSLKPDEIAALGSTIKKLKSVLAGASSLRERAEKLTRSAGELAATDGVAFLQTAERFSADAQKQLIGSAEALSKNADSQIVPVADQFVSERQSVVQQPEKTEGPVDLVADRAANDFLQRLDRLVAEATKVADDDRRVGELVERMESEIDSLVLATNRLEAGLQKEPFLSVSSPERRALQLEQAGDLFLARADKELLRGGDTFLVRADQELLSGGNAFSGRADAIAREADAIARDADALLEAILPVVGRLFEGTAAAKTKAQATTQGVGCTFTTTNTISGSGLIIGTPFNDLIIGSTGNDLMFGGLGSDRMRGGPGADFMFGNSDDDDMYGEAGNDFMFGNQGNDCLSGDDGIDLMFGNQGNDLMHGNDGPTVTFTVSGVTVSIKVGDLIFGNDGDDEMYGDEGLDLMLGNTGDTMNGNDGSDFILGNQDDDTMHGDNGIDFMFGNQDKDTMHGDNGIDLMWGNEDKDKINGNDGADFLWGNADGDTMKGDNGIDFMLGNQGNDTMNGNAGADFMFGSTGIDTMNGNDGIDSMSGGDDGDTMNGDLGTDLMWGNQGNDTMNGNDGTDLMWGNQGDDTMYGSAGSDLMFGNDGDDCMDGGAGNDVMFGNEGNDRIFGGLGNDRMFGNDGDDCLDGGAGTDLMFGNQGNDTMLGGAGNDIMFGNRGDDLMDGGAGTDLMFGNQDNDNMFGGPGIDLVLGGLGNNTTSQNGSSGATCPLCSTTTPACDLKIEKKVQPTTLVSGQQATATITVTNLGGALCSGPTTVAETVPAGLTLVSASGPGWSCSGAVCTYANPIPVNGSVSVTYTFNVTAQPGTAIQNCATVSNANDNNPANNQSCVTTPVVPTAVCDREIKKTVTPNPAQSGQQVTTTLTVTNVGTAPCPVVGGINLADSQPSGLTFLLPVTANKPGWSCGFTGSGVTAYCTSTSPLLPGAANAVTVTFTANVTAPAGSTIQNCAQITNVGDAVQANNNSCVNVPVN